MTPKFRKGERVFLIKEKYEGVITCMAFLAGIIWYDLDDKYVNIAEHELRKVK